MPREEYFGTGHRHLALVLSFHKSARPLSVSLPPPMVSPRSYLPKSPVLLPSAPSSFLNHTDDEGAVGLFAPRPQPLSKIADHRSVSAQSVGPMETFFATCSRVVRVCCSLFLIK